MDVGSYIVGKALVLIPVLMAFGKIIKDIPNIPNWIIPIILFAVGIVGGMAVVGWTVDGAIQGILVGGTAIGVHQVYTQTKDGSDSSDTEIGDDPTE